MNQPELIHSFRKLLTWIETQDLHGYDPYDIKGLGFVIRIIQKSQKSKSYVYLRELLFEIFYSFPHFSRKLLNVKPSVNPKAAGLIASSYIDLYKTTGSSGYLEQAKKVLSWLETHKGPTNTGFGWGYPFDWQSTRFIPANTPNGIVTTAVAEAFREFYDLQGGEGNLTTLKKIGDFLYSLPKDQYKPDQICFSYTPLFQNHVHNLNLFVAEYLMKTASLCGRSEWMDAANQAVNYTLACQNPDGSFDYNGPPEPPARFIDHYHTGFVLRMLYSIWQFSGRSDVRSALDKGFRFYLHHFFHKGTIPKLKPEKIYRVDIHSCAEAVILLSTLAGEYPEAGKKAGEILDWTISNFQDKQGFFYYGLLKSRFTGVVYKSKIPYFRWGQAWMLRAFTKYFSFIALENPNSLC